MLRFKGQLSLSVSLLVLFSCTIIKDSDITSLDQLNNLKLTSIEIVQNLNDGASSSIATVVDSLYKIPAQTTIDINEKISGSLVKQSSITWPVSTNSKLQFKSGITSGVVIKNHFYANGAPHNSLVYEKNVLKERYTFFYDKNYILTNVISTVFKTPVDSTVFRDSLYYGTSGIELGLVTSIHRKFPVTNASPVTINFPYTDNYGGNTNLGNGNSGASINTTYGSFQFNYGNCLCPNNSDNNCFGCDAQLSTSQGSPPTSHYIIEGQQLSNLLSQLEITDVKVSTNSSCGQSGSSTTYDTYYYYPLMLFRGLFTNGDILLNIYAIDWLKPPTTATSTNFTNNETLTLNFKYAN